MGLRDWLAERYAYNHGFTIGKEATINTTANIIEDKYGQELSDTTKDIMKGHFRDIADQHFLKGLNAPEEGELPENADPQFKHGIGNFSLFMEEVGQHGYMAGSIVEMAKNPELMGRFTDAFKEDRNLMDKIGPAMEDPQTLAAFKDAIKNHPDSFTADSFHKMAASPDGIQAELARVNDRPAGSYTAAEIQPADLVGTIATVDATVRAVEKIKETSTDPAVQQNVDTFLQDIVDNKVVNGVPIQEQMLSVATAASVDATAGSVDASPVMEDFINTYATQGLGQAVEDMNAKVQSFREAQPFLNAIKKYAADHPDQYGADLGEATAQTLVRVCAQNPDLLAKFGKDDKDLQEVGGPNSPSVMEGLLDLQAGRVPGGKTLEDALTEDGGQTLRMEIAMEHASRLVMDGQKMEDLPPNRQAFIKGLETDPELRQMVWENKDAFNTMNGVGSNVANMFSGFTKGAGSPIDFVADKYAEGTLLKEYKDKGFGGLKSEFMSDAFGSFGPLMDGMSNWFQGMMQNLVPMLEGMMQQLMGMFQNFMPAFANSGFVSKLTMGANNGQLLGEFDGSMAKAAQSFGHSVSNSWQSAKMQMMQDEIRQAHPEEGSRYADNVQIDPATGAIMDQDHIGVQHGPMTKEQAEQLERQQQQLQQEPTLENSPLISS